MSALDSPRHTVTTRARVGTSDVELSRIGLGGYQLGPEPDEEPDIARAVQVIERTAHREPRAHTVRRWFARSAAITQRAA